MMRMIHGISLPCMQHRALLQRGFGTTRKLSNAKYTPRAVLSECPATYDIRAAELQDWITRQRSALPDIGAELQNTKDGPSAEELEASKALTHLKPEDFAYSLESAIHH